VTFVTALKEEAALAYERMFEGGGAVGTLVRTLR
jgi:hypothetical protein